VKLQPLEFRKKAIITLDKLLAIGKRIYYKQPELTRFVFWPAIRIYSLIRRLYYDQWILDGVEINSGQRLIIRFTGNEHNKNYWGKLAYVKDFNEIYAGKKWVWQFLKANSEHQFDLIVNEIPSFLKIAINKEGFLIPCWIRGEIDLPEKFSSQVNREYSVANDLRRIKKNHFSYVITHEIPDFEEFYRDMYLPYTISRWGKLAIFSNYDMFKKYFLKGYIVLVKKEDLVVAGYLVSFEKDMPLLVATGIKNGNLEYLKMGALSASYYFTLQDLQNRGYHKVCLGFTRAFLNDSVLQYKKNWGLRVAKTAVDVFYIRPISKSAGIESFLINNPFICVEDNYLGGRVFINDMASTSSAIEALKKRIYTRGLAKFTIQKI
jgi:hypothetical protein